jgi:DNA-binding response OmpR family regulator
MTHNNIVLKIDKLIKNVNSINKELNELLIMLAKRDNVVISDYVLNCDTYTFDFVDKKIELSNTEFEVLYFIASNMPNITTSKSLSEYLYPDEQYIPAFDRNISVNICYINKKIQRLIGNKIIKHRRGVGYFINEKIY